MKNTMAINQDPYESRIPRYSWNLPHKNHLCPNLLAQSKTIVKTIYQQLKTQWFFCVLKDKNFAEELIR